MAGGISGWRRSNETTSTRRAKNRPGEDGNSAARQRLASVVGLSVLLVVGGSVILAGAAGIAAADHDSGSGTQHVLGGDEVDGTLRITVTDGNIAVERWDGTQWVKQYYDVHSSDTALVVGGTVYDTPGGDTADASGMELTVSDQYTTNGGTTVVTEFEPAGETGLVLVQKVSYDPGAEYFDLEWEVRNTGAEPVSNLRLLNGKDTFLAGGDDGFGFWSGNLNTIGVTKTIENEQQRLAMRGITDPYNHQSDYYYNVLTSMEAGELTGNVDTTDHDNAYALEWRRDSLGAGETWTVRARESFTRASVVVTGPGTVSSSGEAVDLQFTVDNVGETETTVSFSTSGPSGWTLSTPTDLSIASGGTETVTVTATPPDSTGDGLYDVTLTASSATSVDSATGQVDLTADSGQQQPLADRAPKFEITSHSVNRSKVAVGEPVRATFTVTNEGNDDGEYEPLLTSERSIVGNREAVGLEPDESHTYTYTLSWDDIGTKYLAVDHEVTDRVRVVRAEQLRPGELTLRHAYLTRSTAQPGKDYSVVALVENSDDRAGALELDFLGSENASVARSVRLEPGERKRVRISQIAPGVDEATDLSWRVEAGNGQTLEAGNVTVRPANGTFDSGIVDAYLTRATVEPGEPYSAVAVVRNTRDERHLYAVGYSSGTGNMALDLVWVPAGETVEVSHRVVASEPGTVSWTVGPHEAGSVNVTASGG